MNMIWLTLMCVSIVIAVFTGRVEELTKATIAVGKLDEKYIRMLDHDHMKQESPRRRIKTGGQPLPFAERPS
jgi:hypothetical protein